MEIQKHFDVELAQQINDKLLEVQELIEQATKESKLNRADRESDFIQMSTRDLELVATMQTVYANCALSMRLVKDMF